MMIRRAIMIAVPFQICCSILLLLGLTISSASAAATSTAPPPPHNGTLPLATLHNGIQIPLIGLGCSGRSGIRQQHVTSALSVGYRYFDTAQSSIYHEQEVGDAIREYIESTDGIERSDILVQTKIPTEYLGYQATKDAVQISLNRLEGTSLDSVLLHSTKCHKDCKDPSGTWQDSWRALEEMYDAGIIRAIGICNIDESLLDEVLQYARIKPYIIQNWMDPFQQGVSMRRRCNDEGILYQAYSSLGMMWVRYIAKGEDNPVLTDPTLLSIAQAHGVDVAQVVINWTTRHGLSVIPASTDAGRQRNNLDSFGFDLTDEEMQAIDSLDGTGYERTKRNNKKKASGGNEL